MFINQAVFHYYSYSGERRKKERGYQTVNLGALSRLKPFFPNHQFWNCEKLLLALDFVRNNENNLIRGINTKHGSLLQGVSIAEIRHRFGGITAEEQRRLLMTDLNVDADSIRGVLEIREVDENTQAALVSKLTGLPNIKIR
jgi:hypothetical protein